MSKPERKTVLSFDGETQTYKPAGHNFSVEQAVEEVDKIQADGGTAAIVAQESHHRSLSFHQCRPCKKAAESFGEQQSQPGIGGEDQAS